MNTQTKSLISWAKKYMDVDSRLDITIENRNIRIEVNNRKDGEEIELLLLENLKVVYRTIYDFKNMKWKVKK